ncbi:unnamed protein product [Sphenostylis stenocarpa]|uniref:Uncharacterized protein n=1 Tax=Sphenostylis stenocarpa TaxID=92480 RepID=A0AA86VKN5_9FABA|nr:unnamed protein product [Sphenostylis stenocarpa]
MLGRQGKRHALPLDGSMFDEDNRAARLVNQANCHPRALRAASWICLSFSFSISSRLSSGVNNGPEWCMRAFLLAKPCNHKQKQVIT